MVEGGAGFESKALWDGGGLEKPNRSSEALTADGFEVGAVLVAKLKSARPLDDLGVTNGVEFWVLFGICGLDADAGFGAGFMPVSKKFPPLEVGGDLIGGEVNVDLWADG